MTTHENTQDKVIRIIGLANGGETAFDGQYVVIYDPGRDGVEPTTKRPMRCYLQTTPDITRATRYDLVSAHRLWTAEDPRNPIRPDGKPNRPLTAFTVTIEPMEKTSA